MLRTDDRVLFSEALTPPDGYLPDLIVGTTFSLHLAALLAVPLGLTFSDWENDDGAPTRDPVALLEAVRRYADKVTVFCQAGATANTAQPPLVASWLEQMVVPVKAPFGGVFHPKMWVARYRNQDGQRRYRMLCGSRNLTFDRCWDTVVVLDGTPTPRGGRAEEAAPLARFVASLPGLAVAGIEPRRTGEIEALARELERVRFPPPDGFDQVSFWPLGIAGQRADPLAAVRITRMLVVSPFIGRTRLERIASEQPQNILVSRGDELELVATGELKRFSELYTFDEGADLEQASADDAALSGLHAKVYVADAGWHAHLWTGSANATTAAFRDNVEFLVRLDGLKSVCGINRVLGKIGEDHALANLLQQVDPQDSAGTVDPKVALERELDDIAHALAERQLTATVIDRGDIDYEVALRSDPALELAADLQIECWPLTGVAERDAQPVKPSGADLAVFARQRLGEITAFYAFALTLERNGVAVRKEMVVRADLANVPVGRHQAILRDVFQDPEQVMRLLRALLNFDRELLITGLGPPPDEARRSAGSEHHPEPALLEEMLRALIEAPDRIDAINSLIDDLLGELDVLPESFLQIWQPIAIVRAELSA